MEEPYVIFKDKLNFKWPGSGAFPPHQDFPAYENFVPRSHITAMITIDKATLSNGCLHVAKDWKNTFSKISAIDQKKLASGQATIPFVEGGEQHGTIETEFSKLIEWLPLTTSPRDLVIFDSFIPHFSFSNNSAHSRKALFLTYNKLSEGEHHKDYFSMKRSRPNNPDFHFATPTS